MCLLFIIVIDLMVICLCIVLGALIGKQKGRNLEIMNSFELVFHVIDKEVVIDREYYSTKEDQCMQDLLTCC